VPETKNDSEETVVPMVQEDKSDETVFGEKRGTKDGANVKNSSSSFRLPVETSVSFWVMIVLSIIAMLYSLVNCGNRYY